MRSAYVHGYDTAESLRLNDQAATLEALLHHDTCYPAGSVVLEAGCGVGAQTVPLVRSSPGARITCLDISAASRAEAAARVRAAGLPVPQFRPGDLLALPFPDAAFDHVFVCFVLEHLRTRWRRWSNCSACFGRAAASPLIEGDHGSTLFHPDDAAARAAIRCQVELQRRAGGDADIGRRLYPLLRAAGFPTVRVSPRQVYVDASRPELVDGFIRKTFTAMVAGVRDEAIRAGLTDAAAFDAGIQAPAPHGGAGWRVLLHLLQGDQPQTLAPHQAGRRRRFQREHRAAAMARKAQPVDRRHVDIRRTAHHAGPQKTPALLGDGGDADRQDRLVGHRAAAARDARSPAAAPGSAAR